MAADFDNPEGDAHELLSDPMEDEFMLMITSRQGEMMPEDEEEPPDASLIVGQSSATAPGSPDRKRRLDGAEGSRAPDPKRGATPKRHDSDVALIDCTSGPAAPKPAPPLDGKDVLRIGGLVRKFYLCLRG
jgi:hypothetical protein